MKIKDSANLKYDKRSSLWTNAGDYEPLDLEPRVCVLDNFKRIDDSLLLNFKNGSHAFVRAKNAEGMGEINLVALKLPEMIKISYEEILETEF